jgi:hypothetical protein
LHHLSRGTLTHEKGAPNSTPICKIIILVLR